MNTSGKVQDLNENYTISYNNFCTKCGFQLKAVPLQAWTGPEGSRKLRLPDFVTRAQDGGNTLIWRDKFTSFQKRERTLGK